MSGKSTSTRPARAKHSHPCTARTGRTRPPSSARRRRNPPRWQIQHADCVKALPKLPANSVHAIVTDPPYGLEFMGKKWDDLGVGQSAEEWHQAWVLQALRVLKPGGYLLAFGGTRTFHRLTCALEDTGFEIRDCICWLYGQGLPKSLNVSEAIDRRSPDRANMLKATAWMRERLDQLGLTPRDLDDALGTKGMGGHYTARSSQPAIPTTEAWERLIPLIGEPPRWIARLRREAWRHREITGYVDMPSGYTFARPARDGASVPRRVAIYEPATNDARRWIGWGTTLKPAWEPIIVARKPIGGTTAENVCRHGTGALNIDGCRIAFQSEGDQRESKTKNRHTDFGSTRENQIYGHDKRAHGNYDAPGRWPANVILSHTDDCQQTGHTRIRASGHHPASRGPGGLGTAGHRGQANLAERSNAGELVGCWECSPDCPVRALDAQSGQVSRFFYCAKASTSERNAGLDGQSRTTTDDGHPQPITKAPRQNSHPTVKPLTLMSHLVRLVTPQGGVVLDPFTGSGSTGIAAVMGGARFIGIEREADYITIARARIRHWAERSGGRRR